MLAHKLQMLHEAANCTDDHDKVAVSKLAALT